MPAPWEINLTSGFERSFKQCHKRHPEACTAAWARLQNFLDRWLNNPLLTPGFHLPGWDHIEGAGVLAVDQGTKSHLTQVRLYFWLEKAEQKVWLLRMGDKSQQYADIAYCHVWVRRFELSGEDD